MIGIRVDANNEIAMGHLMRCMSIATCLKESGQTFVFIMSQPYGIDFLDDKGFSYIILDNQYDDKISETDNLIQILQEQHIDKLLVDSYQVNFAYMDKLKDVVKLIYIDDMISEYYPVERLFNYALGISSDVYYRLGYSEDQLFLGEQYTPLRKEFAGNPIAIKENVENIFISTGGTDSFHMVVALLELLSDIRYQNIKKTIVVGKFFEDDALVHSMMEQDDTIVFLKDVKEVASVMRQCDVAISAGGTTLAELAACGVPTVCFSIADNQLNGVNAYGEKGVLAYVGDVRNGKEQLLIAIKKHLDKLLDDKRLRIKYSENGKNTIDGRGAMRIAELLITSYS